MLAYIGGYSALTDMGEVKLRGIVYGFSRFLYFFAIKNDFKS